MLTRHYSMTELNLMPVQVKEKKKINRTGDYLVFTMKRSTKREPEC